MLQVARSATIFDATGRVTLFLSAVSGSLVALAFVGQATGLGQGFFALALLVLPTLVFVGAATFARVTQSAVEDAHSARGINRIRRFYIEQAPSAARSLILPTADDAEAALRGAGARPSRWQPFLTTVGMVEAVNRVLVGAFANLLAAALGVGPLPLVVGIGTLAFAVALVLHHRTMLRVWERFERETRAALPPP